MYDFFTLSLTFFAYPLTARVFGAPQMTSQPVSSIFSLFSTALWELVNSRPFSTALLGLANSRPVYSVMLFSHLSFCPPCLRPPFTVPCKMVLARHDERETCPYHFALRLFFRWSRGLCGPIACWILVRTYSYCTSKHGESTVRTSLPFHSAIGNSRS